MMQLSDVGVVFGELTALHPTSIAFVRGELAILLGSSGAGKSTLLRCLNHLTPPTSGAVTVAGLGDLRTPRFLHEHRRRTGMVFQQHQLIKRYTALQNVLLGRLGYHSALRTLFPLTRHERRIALECLARVGLLHKALERVDRLSGGQQQRIGIARALAQQPQILLADEPVASLDPATAHTVLTLLQRICKEDGIAMVVSLHQVELATAYADRIVGLAAGRVVFDGAPTALGAAALETIYRSPTKPEPMSGHTASTPSYDLATIED